MFTVVLRYRHPTPGQGVWDTCNIGSHEEETESQGSSNCELVEIEPSPYSGDVLWELPFSHSAYGYLPWNLNHIYPCCL